MSQTLIERLQALPDLVNADPELLRRGRLVSLDLLIGLGELPCYLSIETGRIAALHCGMQLMRPWRFAIRGSVLCWERHWETMPPPHFHDLFALAKRGHLVIEGDIQPLMANLFYFKDVLAAPRRAGGG